MTTEAGFILLVEDQQKIAANTAMQLREEGFAVQPVVSAEAALVALDEHADAPDLMLLDVRLGGMSGIDLIRRLTTEKRLPPTIIISGEASMGETVEAMNNGVWDFIEKPFTRERLLQSIRNCLEHAGLKRQLSAIHSRDLEILGSSPEILHLRDRIARAAPTTARVLIRGESGTGKELAANTLHRLSTRADQPLVKINCAAIPPHLVEDELFGHARGAFTDAKQAKPGLFEEAHRGTLFLDEIGDMEMGLQARLLRVIEDGKVRRIGETHDRQVDVRVVAATNKPLEQMVKEGRFREDLYFRLAALRVDIPPLRDRNGDVAMLFRHYLEMFCTQNKRRRLTIEPDVIAMVERYSWPGNIRELRNVCEQLTVFGTDPVTVEQLPLSIVQDEVASETGMLRLIETAPVMPLREFKEKCEREYIESVLRRTNWSFVEAAKLLDIQRTYLHQKISTLAIAKPPRE